MSHKFIELREATPKKPSYEEMMLILKTILEKRVINNRALAELGFDCGHIQYMDCWFMFPSIGGLVTGQCYLHERLEGTYEYYLQEANKQKWKEKADEIRFPN